MAKVITKKVDKRIGVECTLQEFLEAVEELEIALLTPEGTFIAVLKHDDFDLSQGTTKIDTSKIKMKILPQEEHLDDSFED